MNEYEAGQDAALQGAKRDAEKMFAREVDPFDDEERAYAETVQGAIDYLGHADIFAEYWHSGGGIFVINVHQRREDPFPGVYLTVGTANGNWGFSDDDGEFAGEWEDLPPVCDGEELGARILGTLGDYNLWLSAAQAPGTRICGCNYNQYCGPGCSAHTE